MKIRQWDHELFHADERQTDLTQPKGPFSQFCKST